MPLNLVDYVVAHELSHLIEMNHSPAFWRTVGRIYPGYTAARKELKRLG
jgi:predicted metal-dependent hydrolase